MTSLAALRHRTRDAWASTAVVLAGLVAFVVLTYALLVVLLGRLLGFTDRPSLGLSVVATAVVALGFDPMLTRLERIARYLLHRGRATPYDTLRRFTRVVTGEERAEDLPLRMARLLVEATGAAWAQVWVSLDGAPVAAATWPPEAEAEVIRTPGWDAGTWQLPVRHGGEELGLLVLKESAGSPLTSVEERMVTGLASQAGLVLRGARLRAALRHRLDELSVREMELRVSRERVLDAQDEARRRLERDIHDGAQQHLVALAVNLRLAATLVSVPERATALLDAQQEAAQEALQALAQLSRGIYPQLLGQAGVAAALGAVVSGPGVVVGSRGDARHAAEVEAAAYFCALEALQNAGKHAAAEHVSVEVDAMAAGISVSVTDDGRGFDPSSVPGGIGLANMRDRVDSVRGSLQLTSTAGRGTRVRVWIPAADATDESGG